MTTTAPAASTSADPRETFLRVFERETATTLRVLRAAAGDGARVVDFDDYADDRRDAGRRPIGNSIALSEAEGVVYWHTAYNLQPVEF